MTTKRFWISKLIIAAILLVVSADVPAQQARRVNLGYFEGGKHPVHDLIRTEFSRQLELTLPEDLALVFIPYGFRSAGWKRDSCHIFARELAGVEDIDIMVTMGPWVVEDLLEAGFTKPIVAMYRFDPRAEGLVDENNRPIAPNLTVRIDPDRMEKDLAMLSRLLTVKKLGILFFPSADEKSEILSRAEAIGANLGFEVVTAEGFNLFGTYAFFKAYNELDKKIDALYVAPLWDMDAAKITELFRRAADQRIPVFSTEGRYAVDRGAFASDAGQTFLPEAASAAAKIVRIVEGANPADLAVDFPETRGLLINLETAENCRVRVPDAAVNEAYIVEAPPADDVPLYTLRDAVSRALERNPGFLAGYDALEAAAQAAGQAYSQYLPQIYATGGINHFDDNTVYNTRGLIEENRYAATISFSQRLFSLETIRNIQLSAQNRNLEQIDVEQARLDLELGVNLAYLNYLQAGEYLMIQKQDRELIDRNLEIANCRRLAMADDRVDYVRWEDERTRATQNIISARVNLDVARVLLNVLLNLPGDSRFTLDEASFSMDRFWQEYENLYSFIVNQSERMEFEQSLAQIALSISPRLRRHDVRLGMARTSLSLNTARYMPTVGFRAALHFRDELANRLTFEEEHNTWSVSALLSLPLFLGGDRIHERRRLKARLSEIEFDRDAASLDVMGRVRATASTLIEHVRNTPLAVRRQELARENYELVATQYESGKTSLIDVLDARENVLGAENAYVSSRYRYFGTLATLVHDIGWSPSESNTTFNDEFYQRVKEIYNR
ncbi:MAG: TolC family protein [candidate division Zixibacteria bacterium]|nr:TolC family protein [candidate division Zixibacteria bacterium]